MSVKPASWVDRVWPMYGGRLQQLLLAAVAAALVFHALFPRYEWHAGSVPRYYIRYDRWTGAAAMLEYGR